MERSQIWLTNHSANNVSGNNFRKTLLVFLIIELLIIAGLTAFIIIMSVPSVGAEANNNTRAPSKLSGLPENGKYSYVTLANVNKDEYIDIIAGAGGYPGGEPGGLYVYLNQGGTSFTEASKGLPGESGNYFGSVQVIDVNKDSNMDIIASYESRWSGGEAKGIGIWLGNGGAGGSMIWSQANSPVTSGSYDSAFCGDINNDGQLDLVGGSSKGLYAWQGSHTGGTLSWTSVSDGLSTSNEYTGVTLGDINNDGRLDIVAGSYSSRGISVYICSSSGSISWTEGNKDTNLKSSGNTFDNYLIDLNQDSKLDLVSSIRGGIKVYLGNGNSGSRDTWWEDVSSGLPTSSDYYKIAIGDVNTDGKLDICSNFQIWSNSGSMSNPDSYSWSQLEVGAALSEPIGTAVGDLNDDDNLDIVGCGWGSGVVAYTLTLGSGSGVVKIKYLLSGVMKDSANGEPIADVTVKLEPGGYSGKTDGQGRYTMKAPNGTYTLSYSISGYLSDSENVVINGNSVVKDVEMVVGEDPKEDKKEDDSGLPFMELPIVIFTILIVIIIFKMSNRKK